MLERAYKIDSVCLQDLHLVSTEGHEVTLSVASCISTVATSDTFHKTDYRRLLGNVVGLECRE